MTWPLAHKLQSPNCQDALVDALSDKMNQHFGIIPIDLGADAYSRPKARGEAFRRFALDVAAMGFDGGTVRAVVADGVPGTAEYMADLAARYADLRWDEDERKGLEEYGLDGGCAYHEHVAVGGPCYKTMFP